MNILIWTILLVSASGCFLSLAVFFHIRLARGAAGGTPVAALGMGFYAGTFLLALLYAEDWLPLWPLAALIAIGLAFSLYFLYLQIWELRARCLWCVASAALCFLLAGVAWLLG